MLGFVRTTFLGLCALSSIGALAGQTSMPGQAVDPADAQTPDAAPYRIKVKVNRVILDVVVTDAKGKPVQGLTQNDFKVSENGVPQSIRSFDVHSTALAGTAQPPLDLHLPPNTFSNLSLAPPDRPVTILLYDMLNTPQDSLPLAHAALVKFIKGQKGSTRIAIFALTDRLHMLQGFTDDETRLMASIDAKHLKTGISQLRVADTASNTAVLLAGDPSAPAAVQMQSSQTTAANSPVGADAVLAQLQNAEAEESAFEVQQQMEITVEAFGQIARFVSALPGRKNLIWMSGSFPSAIFPNGNVSSGSQNEFNNEISFNTQVQMAQNVLKESRVAVYPVDVRGLQVDPQFSAAANYAAPPPTTVSFGQQNAAEHATMDSVADSTGGHAFYNTNGLEEAMNAALQQGSQYYTLTYAPSDTKADGSDRRIKVTLDNPSYQLAYRRHYLADDAKQPAAVEPIAQDLNMQHGAPDSSQLFFEAKLFPVGGVMPASPAEVEGLRKFLETDAKGKRAKGLVPQEKVQHYGVDLALIGRQLDMPATAHGNYLTSMRFGLAGYTSDGELLNGTEVTVKNAVSPAVYQKIESDGYHASMMFPVPVDATSLRIAVRDEIGNRVGTMEVPLPLAATPGAAKPATTK